MVRFRALAIAQAHGQKTAQRSSTPPLRKAGQGGSNISSGLQLASEVLKYRSTPLFGQLPTKK